MCSLSRPNWSKTSVPPPNSWIGRRGIEGLRDRQLGDALELAGAELEHLHVGGDRLGDDQAVGCDPLARADGLDHGVVLRADAEPERVLPQETGHLVPIRAQGCEVEAEVVRGDLGLEDVGHAVTRSPYSGLLEPVDQHRSVAEVVIRDHLGVGEQYRVEQVAELELDRRQVVQAADHHGEQLRGSAGALLGGARPVEGGHLALAIGRDQRLEPLDPDVEEYVEHDRDQHLTASVRLLELGKVGPVGRRWLHRGPTERAAALGQDLAELLGHTGEHAAAQRVPLDLSALDPAVLAGLAERLLDHRAASRRPTAARRCRRNPHGRPPGPAARARGSGRAARPARRGPSRARRRRSSGRCRSPVVRRAGT